MRRYIVLLPVAVCLLAIPIMSGCRDDPKEPAPEPGPVGQLVDVTGCNDKAHDEDPPVLPTDRGFLFWSYEVNTGLLRVEHVNAGLNCCPEYTATITIAGDQLVITETETQGQCNCLCLYDFAFEVTNLPVGLYEITVDEEYLESGDPLLEGVIDLTQAEFGTIQAMRDHYPWDMPQ